MEMKRGLIIVLCLVIFTGCQQIITEKLRYEPIDLSDSRFNGKFDNNFDASGTSFYDTEYTFRGISYCIKHTESNNYHYIYDIQIHDYEVEIEISNGQFRERLWENKFSNWSEWKPYSFNSDGNLVLDGKIYVKK
jgi:hypothetical protein